MRKAISMIMLVAVLSTASVYGAEGWWTFTSTQVSVTQRDSDNKETAILMSNVYFVPDTILSFDNNSQMVGLSFEYLQNNLVRPLGGYGLDFSAIATPIHQCRVADIRKESDQVANIWQKCMDKVGGGLNVYTYDVDLARPLNVASANIKLVKKDSKQPAILENALRNR